MATEAGRLTTRRETNAQAIEALGRAASDRLRQRLRVVDERYHGHGVRGYTQHWRCWSLETRDGDATAQGD